MNSLKKPIAFLKRDFLIASSYKFSFLFDIATISFSIMTFFYVSKLFGRQASPYLAEYGGEYFPFVVIGLAFSNYMSVTLSSFASGVNEEQYSGTLEFLLLSPTKLTTILFSSCIWNFIFASLRIILYLFIGALFFGLDLSKINIISSLAVFALTILTFSSLGILSAGFIMVFKKGDPVNWAFNGVSRLLGGIYFPIAILPIWLQKFSFILPITYALRGMRMAVLNGASIKDISFELLILSGLSLTLLPLSIFLFHLAVRKAKRNGSLSYY